MRFYFVPLAAFCYVLLRTILPARIHPLAKALFALAAFLPAGRRFYQGAVLDGTVLPEAPAFVFALLAFLCACLVFFFLLSLVRDAGLLLAALATVVHSFCDCPLRSPAVLSLFFVILAALPGFMPNEG